MTQSWRNGARMIPDGILRRRVAILAGVLAATVFLSALVIEAVDRSGTGRPAGGGDDGPRPALLHPLLSTGPGGGEGLLDATPSSESAPDRITTFTRRARALCDMRNFPAAAEFYRAILALDKSSIEAQLALGSIALDARRYGDAEEYLGRLNMQLPKADPVVCMRLGSAQFRQGKIGLGLQNLERAYRDRSEDGALCFELACAYAAVGDADRSYLFLRRASDLLGGLVLAFMSDPHLDPIRETPYFRALMRHARDRAFRTRRRPAAPEKEKPEGKDAEGAEKGSIVTP